MAERERFLAPPRGGVFVPRAVVMTPDEVRRAITRIAHEVLERNNGATNVKLIGLQTGGVPLAERLAATMEEIEGTPVEVGTLDVAFFRDDHGLRPVLEEAETKIPFDLNSQIIVLVDDVLFTGRTLRAALNALFDFGRPESVQLAVMVDRGHRELPFRADYVGKNLPTRRDEQVDVGEDGVVLGDVVVKP